MLTGLAGVIVLMKPNTLAGLGCNWLGQFLILGAALSYAVGAVYGRRFRELPPVAAAAGMLVFASLYFAPAAFMFETPFSPVPDWGPIAAMLALALLSSALAYILYFTVLKNVGATNAMLLTIIQPPLAILLGVTFLGETLSRN